MFAAIARTEMDPATLDDAQLGHMVSVVEQHPGFVSGTWGRDTARPSTVHAVVVFEGRHHAEAFAAGVRGALADAQVDVAEVLARAAAGASG